MKIQDISNTLNDFIATSVDNNEQLSVAHACNLVESFCWTLKDEPDFNKSEFVQECIKNTSVQIRDFAFSDMEKLND